MEVKEKKFRYNDEGERLLRMNRFYAMATTMFLAVNVLYLILMLPYDVIPQWVNIVGIVVSVLFLVENLALYNRMKTRSTYKSMALVHIGILMVYIGVVAQAEYVFICMLASLLLLVPYFDTRVFKRTTMIYTVIYLVCTVINIMKNSAQMNVDAYLRIYATLLGIFVINRVGLIIKEFNDDALGSIAEQSQQQKNIFDHIVGVSKDVKDEADKSFDLVDQLMNMAEAVSTSMEEISTATNSTATNLEEQNIMTQNIQQAIEETGSLSKNMVGIATESNESIRENIQVFASLIEQSKQITETNQDVTNSMNRLQNKTREVEEIAGMILEISSQTNLLALNASIESARAGEAGRGFAVVADQIRQLAEQTKKSTEEITNIVNELNANAMDVVRSVEVSVRATEAQNEKILTASETFEKLNTNMTELISDVNEVDRQIGGLSASNNEIVNHIAHLSSFTEEVTASAEHVRGMSERNLEFVGQVKNSIGTIEDSTDSMKQYL